MTTSRATQELNFRASPREVLLTWLTELISTPFDRSSWLLLLIGYSLWGRVCGRTTYVSNCDISLLSPRVSRVLLNGFLQSMYQVTKEQVASLISSPS